MSAPSKNCGWGWVIVVAAFVNNFILDGVRYSYGLLEFLQEFKRGKGETSGIGSLLFGSMFMGGIAAGVLVNKFGCKAVSISGTLISWVGYIASIFAGNVQHLYVTFGIIGGIGFSLSTLALNVIVMQWFDRRRSLAYGLAACGPGGIVFNPLSKWLIDVYGWRGTFLIETAIILNGIACGLVMRPFPGKTLASSRKQLGKTSSPNNHEGTFDGVDGEEKSKARSLLGTGGVLDSQLETLKADKYIQKEGYSHNSQDNCGESKILCELDFNADRSEQKHKNSKKLFKFDLLTNPGFLVFCLSYSIKSFSYMVPFIYLPDMVVTDGLNRTQAAWLISFIGIANTVCKPIAGWIGDKKWISRTITYSLALLVSGVCIGLFPFLKTFHCLVIVCLLFGLSIVLLVDFYGEIAVANTIGIQYFFAGIGSLVGPPVAGWMFDVWKRYDIPFTVAGSEFTISGILVLLVPCIQQELIFSCN